MEIFQTLSKSLLLLAFLVLLAACEELSPYKEKLEPVKDKVKPVIEEVKRQVKTKTDTKKTISTHQMIEAMKQALNQGVQDSVYLLGNLEGFNLSSQYRIGVPEKLEQPAEIMRQLGQGDKVDDFELRLNRAAKQAVKQAAPVFSSSIKSMTVNDALNIMKGNDDAATIYFRERTEATLRLRFLPIISKATDQTGLTSTYKSFSKTVDTITATRNKYTVDIDRYVLDNAMKALFERIAIEEKQIRQDPLKRTTDLMKIVYGYFDK